MSRPVSDILLLGYRIQHDGDRRGTIGPLAGTGATASRGPDGYLVLAPDSQTVLGRYAHLAEAERAVIGFELASWRGADAA